MRVILGLLCVLAGVGLWVFTISILISWVAICFGTIILGILLLIFAPHILLFPLIMGTPATGLIFSGFALINGKIDRGY